jgi:hypothetical protein
MSSDIQVSLEIDLDYVSDEAFYRLFGFNDTPPQGTTSELVTDDLMQVKQDIGESYDTTIGQSNLILLTYQRDNVQSVSRELMRDGERVVVVYFSLTQSPLNMLVDLVSSDTYVNSTLISLRMAGYEHMMVEVYFIDVDIDTLNTLDESDFDAQRTYGILIWTGLM